MRRLMIATAALALMAAPAFASTLTEVTTHGMVITLGGMDIPVTFTADGKLSVMDGQDTGTWRIDGDKLCTVTVAQPTETCIAYPADKKSGDTFELHAPDGTPVQIKIR